MGNFNEKLPKWQNPGTEPPASKQEEGWQPQERPPAGWLNWLFNRSYKAIEELQEKAVTQDEGDFAARQELEEHKADDSAHGIGNKLQEFSEHVIDNVRHIYQGETPPQDAEEGSLWLDTSDNAYQGTVMEDYLETKQRVDSHLADYVRQPGYAITGGSGNAYTVSTNPGPTVYVDGIGIIIRANRTNTGASTLNWNSLGAVPIVDGKGNALTAGKIPNGARLSLRYSSAASNFQLLGEGGEYGTAGAAQVLTGFSIGTENGLVNGSMPNRGNVGTQTISTQNGEHTIQAGYHNGSGKVRANFTNLTTENVKEGVNIGGVIGALKEGGIESVQSGSMSFSDTQLSRSVTISPVDRTKSFLVFYVTGSEGNPSRITIKGKFSNNNTLLFERNFATYMGVSCFWQVITMSNISVQYGEMESNNSGSLAITINSIDTSKSFIVGSFKLTHEPHHSNTAYTVIPIAYIQSTTSIRVGTNGYGWDFSYFVITQT